MSKLNRQIAELRALATQRRLMRSVVSHEADMVKSSLMPTALISRLLDRASERIEAVAGPAVDKSVTLTDRIIAEGEQAARNRPVLMGAMVAAAVFFVARPFLLERNGDSSDDENEAWDDGDAAEPSDTGL